MKRIIKYLVFFVSSFILMMGVKAESISSVDMDIYVDSSGNAHVTEVWQAYPSEKTEYYHAYHNIGKSKITNFKVRDETRNYEYKTWDIDASFEEKAYKYGYNYTNGGVELCFGKSSYQRHTYTLTYTISNFVSKARDADIMYWNLFESADPVPNNVNIVIRADIPFSDTLEVWGYGNYSGLAYVKDGKIYLSSDGTLESGEYMVVLAKFPLNTFNATNILENDFNYYLDMAEKGAKHYSDKSNRLEAAIYVAIIFMFTVFVVALITSFKQTNPNSKTGSYKLHFGKDGKRLPREVNIFRDIPCNKDIFRAYWVASNYRLTKRKTDFLGAILLKWQKEKQIYVQNTVDGKLIKKENVTIRFNHVEDFSGTELEKRLYQYMYAASKDGILEKKEFEKWCQKNYSKILKWFDDVLDYESDMLAKEGKLTKLKEANMFRKASFTVDISMKEEAIRMKGLKTFFLEFKNMEDKHIVDVMLWEEYLMYAQIFGVAKEVANEFKKLYPEVIDDYNYDSVIFIYNISYDGMSSADRSAASAYSSGGGGFSSGGGGGGSFGGGGCGSR